MIDISIRAVNKSSSDAATIRVAGSGRALMHPTIRVGTEGGRKIIYFHGVPGAPPECRLLASRAAQAGLTLICFDRSSLASALTGDAYFRRVAELVADEADATPVDMLGFSIGGFVALQTSRHLAGLVKNLHLVSAVAPLEAGAFLAGMAGEGVFRLAQSHPWVFAQMSWLQGALGRTFPKRLLTMLFASARGEDRRLATDHAFRAVMEVALLEAFQHVPGYVRDIRAYVSPWAATLHEVQGRVHIWHGREDNWSPPSMAEYLGAALPDCAGVEIFDGLSHYSCLLHAISRIAPAAPAGS